MVVARTPESTSVAERWSDGDASTHLEELVVGDLPAFGSSAAGGQAVNIELVGPHLRLSATLAIGHFHRLSDFLNHRQGLIELHDRSRFEVLGISVGPDDRSEIRVRLMRAFDQFHDVRSKNDREVAALIHDLRIDIVEGLTHELRVVQTEEEPLAARSPDIPIEHALQGFDGARAYSAQPGASAALLDEVLGFQPGSPEGAWDVRGERRSSFYAYDSPPPGAAARQGAGTVHHIAFACQPAEQESWRERVARGGAHPTPVIERFYFKSIYFREPSGVLFEIATIGPGFTVDEPLEHLGQKLSLPPDYEHLRATVEPVLTPLPNLRELVQR